MGYSRAATLLSAGPDPTRVAALDFSVTEDAHKVEIILVLAFQNPFQSYHYPFRIQLNPRQARQRKD